MTKEVLNEHEMSVAKEEKGVNRQIKSGPMEIGPL